jgi:hypothetical protein
MSCGTCSEKIKQGASAATGSRVATGGALIRVFIVEHLIQRHIEGNGSRS